MTAKLENVKVEDVMPWLFYQGASFEFGGRRYNALISTPGVSDGPSQLYVFGRPGEDCVTTRHVHNPELLAAIELIVQTHNSATRGS